MATGEETKTADLVESSDREGTASRATPCAACGSPVDLLARFCPACGTPTGDEPPNGPEPDGGQPGAVVEATGREKSVPAAGVPQGAKHARAGEADRGDARHFRCDNCGAEVAASPDQRSYVCPFCDSTYVVELPPVVSGRQTPEFIIGFSVTRDAARKVFRRWVAKNRWFRPGDLRTAEIVDRLQGIYLPFWSFSMVAASRWSARIGEYWYRTETTTTFRNGKPVVRTRQVRETEWWPLEGEHHQYLRRYLISASGGLPQEEALRIGPFRLDALHRYAPYFLAGWMCEEYSITRDEAETKCREAFRRQAQRAVVAFLPGDTNRDVRVETEFSHTGSDLLLLPVYVASYRYREKVFRILINGQTGRVVGDKPISRTRIGVAVAVGLALLVLTALAIWFAGR